MTYREPATEARTKLAGSILLGLLMCGALHGQEKAPPSPAVLADAVLAKDLASVRKLVEQGADIHGLDTRPDVAGANGRRPLNWAALKNDTKMIELLLELGADINRPNLSGFTPLHHAAEAGSVESIKLLLAKGADPKIKNKRGMTPAQVAAALGKSHAAEALGASPQAE